MTITFTAPNARKSLARSTVWRVSQLAVGAEGSSSPSGPILDSPKGFMSPGGRRGSGLVIQSLREADLGLLRKSRSELPTARVLRQLSIRSRSVTLSASAGDRDRPGDPTRPPLSRRSTDNMEV